MKTPRIQRALLTVALTALFVGCGSKAEPQEVETGAIAESYWSDTDHPGALEVTSARANATDGEEVVLVGRVKDFVEGRAVFTLIDMGLEPCNANGEDDCATPWDYCCVEASVQTAGSVTVELPGDDGRPLQADIKGFHGLDHLDTVTVSGKATRDESGNVTLALASLHRR